MRTYKICSYNQSASANNAGNVQILRGCKLKRIRYALYNDTKTDDTRVAFELSISPVSQIGSVGQGAFAQVEYANNFVTSGMAPAHANGQLDLDFPLGAGEYVYLNTYISGTTSSTITIFLDVEER